jgi:ATP-dependent DNA helicase RecG
VKDKAILEEAKKAAEAIVERDPELHEPEHGSLKNYLVSLQGKTPWSKIS